VKRSFRGLIVLCVSLSGAAVADNVTGENELLCAPGYVTHCSSGGECETTPAWRQGIPSFLRIEIDRKFLRSSEDSDEALATPIQQVTRENGKVYLQGVENERAFSMIIDEASGEGSMAIIADGETATAFLYCTVD